MVKDIVLFSDSLSSLTAIKTGNSINRPNIINEIYDLVDNLNVSTTLIWIPSHLGLYGNEIADQLALGLPRVLEYSSTTRVVNYSSNFLLLEYSLISISGCSFLQTARLQSIDELLEFMETWGFAISFANANASLWK